MRRPRRHTTLLLAAALSACPPGPDQTCQHFPVDAAGVVSSLSSSGSVPAVPQMHVVGEPVTVQVFAPLTACISDVTRAAAELYDGANLPVELEPPVVTTEAGVVRADVSFTPQTPGSYLLRVAFEPSLGARVVTPLVVGRAPLDVGHVVPVPLEDCATGVWPLPPHAVACEAPQRPEVAVYFDDGGVTRFEGRQLVTVDDVLWSVEPASRRLQRRVLDGGSLHVDVDEGDFTATELAGMHGRDFALRPHAGGQLVLVTVDADLTVGRTATGFTVDAQRYVTDRASVWRLSTGGCTVARPDCATWSNVLAVEPGFVWQWNTADPRLLNATSLPPPLFEAPATLLPGRRVSQENARGGFERLPLWLEVSPNAPADEAVLVSFADRTLRLSIWPRSRVLRVTGLVAAVKEDDDHVRLVPLQAP